MKMNKKLIVATAACAALLIGSISTSLAWLLDTTNTVENKFHSSTIDVELTETSNDDDYLYDMVPGWTYDKNPTVTVSADSEPCYVFLKVEKSANLDQFLAYTFNNQWTPVSVGSNVYYIEYTGATGATYDILLGGTYTPPTNLVNGSEIIYTDGQVVVKSEVTKDMMDDLKEAGDELTFKFTAAAVQYYKADGVPFSVEDAYKLVQWPTT